MTAHMVPLYATSVLTIGMLAVFARHNRKTGWKKQPGALGRWIGHFYNDLSMVAEEASVESVSDENLAVKSRLPAVPSWAPVTAAESVGFSAQLLHLRSALGAAGAAPASETAPQTRERELVPQPLNR